MPNSASVKKRLRQSLKRRAHNREVKSEVRTYIKQLQKSIEDKASSAELSSQYSKMQKYLDTAARKGIIAKGAAARIKSRLSKRMASVSAA